jgi:hypothetical protein
MDITNETAPLSDSCKCHMLEESPGVTSSKRVWGSILLGGSIAVGIASVVMSFIFGKDSNTAIDVMQTMMATGGLLLGIGVVQDFAKRGKP